MNANILQNCKPSAIISMLSISNCSWAVIVYRVTQRLRDYLSGAFFVFFCFLPVRSTSRENWRGYPFTFTIESWPYGNKGTQGMRKSIFGCFFYIDRSRKVPPTFIPGSRRACRYYIQNTNKECDYHEKTFSNFSSCYADCGHYHPVSLLLE